MDPTPHNVMQRLRKLMAGALSWLGITEAGPLAIGGVALATRLSPLFVSTCLECALVSYKATLGEEPAKEYVGHYCPRGQDLILHILLHSPELASSSPR